MPMRFPQPYRGQPRPKYPRPGKSTRDLRQERIARILVLGIFILITLALFGSALAVYRAHSADFTFAFVIGLVTLLSLFITISIADGLKSINRFRRGYDIDISGEAKEEELEQPEDSDQ